MSRTMAMASLEATMDDKGLPVRRTDLVGFYGTQSGWSDEVIVKVSGLYGLHTGRYAHGAKEWEVQSLDGYKIQVTEWWPLPKEGTGVKVEV